MRSTTPLGRTRKAVSLVGIAALAALAPPPATAAAHPHGPSAPQTWRRLATVPAYLNSGVGDTAAAEISTVTDDGRTVVYTDSPGGRLGFVDIGDPARPRPPAPWRWAASPPRSRTSAACCSPR
nr:hypothetical protein GCM10020092_089950 [Actinoplanes digitatis]